MRISQSDIQLASSHQSMERNETRESLVAWKRGEERTEENVEGGRGRKLEALAINLQQEATKVSFSSEVHRNRPVKVEAKPVNPEDEVMSSLNMRILKAMIEKFTGREIKFFDPSNIKNSNEVEGEQQAQAQTGDVQPVEELGWGLAYDYYESHYEYESTSFSADGIVKTEDGREIEFSVNLNMSREFMSQEEVHIRAGDALTDPLVVNFGGAAAELTQTKFAFDIDLDGREDQISFVKPGSGLLALDHNEDGIINDGNELFGPATSDGFAELSAYDDDKNGWIDENDLVYDRLRIWTKDEAGEDQLFALGDKDVGAIYLGNVSTPFALKDDQNELLGQVRSSGVYLHESSGAAGTIQQLDFVA